MIRSSTILGMVVGLSLLRGGPTEAQPAPVTVALTTTDGTAARLEIGAEGVGRVCFGDPSTCADLGLPDVALDREHGVVHDHLRIWNLGPELQDEARRADGSGCAADEGCRFPRGHLILFLNDQGNPLVERLRATVAEGGAWRLVAEAELLWLPGEATVLALTTAEGCSSLDGLCLDWHWEALLLDRSRSGYRLQAAAGPYRVGRQRVETRTDAAGGTTFCLLRQRSLPVVDAVAGTVALAHGFEIGDETSASASLVWMPANGMFQAAPPPDLQGPAPALDVACSPPE